MKNCRKSICSFYGRFKSSQTDKMIEARLYDGDFTDKKIWYTVGVDRFSGVFYGTAEEAGKVCWIYREEVRMLCEQYDMDFIEMKRWYNGYSFSREKSVYSPNSVIEAVKSGEYGDYWTQTETYRALKIYIEMDEQGLKETIIRMLAGEKCPVDIGTFQNDMTNIHNRDDVLTLLVHLGYLAYDRETESVSIPNEEVRQEFMRAVKSSKYTDIVKLIMDSEKLLQDTFAMNEESVSTAIENIHRTMTAPTFYNNEQALRSVIRFAYISCIGSYVEIRNCHLVKDMQMLFFFLKNHLHCRLCSSN